MALPATCFLDPVQQSQLSCMPLRFGADAIITATLGMDCETEVPSLASYLAQRSKDVSSTEPGKDPEPAQFEAHAEWPTK